MLTRLATSPWLPRFVRARLDTARRDVRMVVAGLAGRHPPPFHDRTRAQPTGRPVIVPRTLIVGAVVRETPDAVSIRLEDAGGAAIAYEPGQFFTVHATIDGVLHKRAYSTSSAPHEGPGVTLTVKRVAGGLVSNHIVDVFATGGTVDVLGPSGSFVADAQALASGHLVLLGGGSGVTPLFAIAKHVLATTTARVTLVYGNRSARDVIFRDALHELATTHAGRFVVRHVLEEPSVNLPARRGRLDQATVTAELESLDLDGSSNATFFVCGPEPMMTATRAALERRGVATSRIREERFSQPHLRKDAVSAPLSTQTLLVVADGATVEAIVAPGRTLLEAGLAAGAPMRFSCTMGGCGACRVKLASGTVDMEEPNCLRDDERAAGYVLACVSRPRSACAVEVV